MDYPRSRKVRTPPFFENETDKTRDPELVEIESKIRVAIRDAVNHKSRKPFHWGGLKGYQQLDAIGQALHRIEGTPAENAYFRQLIKQVDRALKQTHSLAEYLQEAHTWLRQIAACLRYPPSSHTEPDIGFEAMTSQQVKQEMGTLLEQIHQEDEKHLVLLDLHSAVSYRWQLYGEELLHCYDIPGLPPDNLQLESCFNRLRCHQRRISGRKSTKELRDFGQYQVLFMAESEEDLLEQIRRVPLAEYHKHRRRLAEAEAPRKFLHRLHRDPGKTIQRLLDRYVEHHSELAHIAPITYRSPPLCSI